MRVRIDEVRCDGHARCIALVPEVFELDDNDEQSTVVNPTPEGELVGRVRKAARLCPKQAIILEES